jgi:hypothetical protein
VRHGSALPCTRLDFIWARPQAFELELIEGEAQNQVFANGTAGPCLTTAGRAELMPLGLLRQSAGGPENFNLALLESNGFEERQRVIILTLTCATLGTNVQTELQPPRNSLIPLARNEKKRVCYPQLDQWI